MLCAAAPSSSGRTADFESVRRGSNPRGATNSRAHGTIPGPRGDVVKWFNTEVCKTSIHRFESGRRLHSHLPRCRVAAPSFFGRRRVTDRHGGRLNGPASRGFGAFPAGSLRHRHEGRAGKADSRGSGRRSCLADTKWRRVTASWRVSRRFPFPSCLPDNAGQRGTARYADAAGVAEWQTPPT